MREIRWALLAMLTGLCLSACTTDIAFPKDEHDGNQLAVLGALINQQPPIVRISTVQSYGSDRQNFSVPDATVVLYENSTPIDTLRFVSPDDARNDGGFGLYAGDTTDLVDKADYFITIQATGYDLVTLNSLTFYGGFVRGTEKLQADTIHRGPNNSSITTRFVFDYVHQPDIDGQLSVSVGNQIFSPGTNQFIDLIDYPFITGCLGMPAGCVPPTASDGLIFEQAYDDIEDRALLGTVVSDHYAVFMEKNLADDWEQFPLGSSEEIAGAFTTANDELPSNVSGAYGYWFIADFITAKP